MRVIWTKGAVRSLIAIRQYIESDNPAAAAHVAIRIKEAVRNLETFPYAGHLGARANTRELVVAGLPYVVVYRVDVLNVFIARVLHTSQQRV